MQPLTQSALERSYQDALGHSDALTDWISTDQFSASYPDACPWAVGPFERDDSMTFRQLGDWRDPTGIGWTADSIFNPSVIERGEQMFLFYRASPRKESTASRIGLAIRDRDGRWQDSESNPIVYPTLPNELLGCEDPKIYAAEGRYFLFYNGIWPAEGTDEAERFAEGSQPFGPLGCDINLATSGDLVTWEKHGRVVPLEISRLWVKGAVIPRNGRGEAVRIGGEYLMFLSEGCGGKTFVGHSSDLVSWEFREQEYLDLSALGGSLHEVACATVVPQPHGAPDRLVIDFFYGDENSNFAAGQALYSTEDPFNQRALSRGGSLAWGGLIDYRSTWTFAQGWDAPAGHREIYFYRSCNHPSDPKEGGNRDNH